MASLGAVLALGSTLIGGVGAVASGASQASAMRAQADAAERQSKEVEASAQREAIQRRKEANLVLSRQQALAASSGGSATDTTILNLAGDTAAQGQYNVSSAVAEGQAQGAGLRDQAAIYRQNARQAMLGGFIDAGGTLLSGFSSYMKYRPYDPYATSTAMPTLRYPVTGGI